MAEAALKYAGNYSYSTAAAAQVRGAAIPAARPGEYERPELKPSAIPVAQPRRRVKPRHRYGVSLFAVFGFAFAGVLVVFLMLAHVNLNEISSETIKLQNRLLELEEQERRLEIEYERTFDLNEVERYAMYELGMAKPDAEQISVLETAPQDTAEIIDDDGGENPLGGLGSFLSSLLEYF